MKEALFVAVVLLLAFGYPYAKSYYEQLEEARTRVYSDEYFITNEPVFFERSPRIVEAILKSETAEAMVFEVKYIIPSFAPSGDYHLSVHPDMGHWAYSSTNVKYGEYDTVDVRVSFRPQEEGVESAQSSLMKFYLSHSKDNKWVGYAFQRDVPYHKVWQKL